MTFGEDMSYNHGPMLSKALYDEFMAPYYRRIVPALRARGILPLIDSDGDITVPAAWFDEVGLAGILPLERQSGVDVEALRQTHPRMRFVGHFDKMTMNRGTDTMRAEVAMRMMFLSLLLLSSLGCEQTTSLTVSLTIPVEVMLGIPEGDFPQQVGFGTTLHNGATATVCAPGDEDVVVTLEDIAGSCVQAPLVIDVVMGPYVPPNTGCVVGGADPYSALSAGEITAVGTGEAFADASEVTCISRDEVVEIELALPEN